MQLQHQKITLDINDTRAFTILNAHQGDSKTRFIDIALTENGNTITLSSNYVATVKASINSKTKAVNTAVVDTTNNVVTVELTKTMLDTPGLLNCEVILQDNQQFVTSATFTVKVAESVISDESEIVASQEFGKLLDALTEIEDIEDKADRVQTLVDNIDKLESADDIVTRLSNVESKETQLETQHRTDVQALTDKANSIVDQANTDRQNFNNSVDEINTTLDTKENVSNKVSEITHPSLDYYPDTKAVFDYVNSKLETPLSDIESLKSDKLDKTDFNRYKTSNDNAVANNSTLIRKNQINVTTDKSTSIVLNDSSDCNIVDLICDDTDNSKQIAFYRKNLFDFNSIRVYGNDSASNIVVNKDNKSISFTTSETGVNSGVYIMHNNYLGFKGYGIDYTKLSGKPVALSFDIQSDINCKIGIEFIQLYSCNYFDITPTKQRIVVTDTVDINKLNNALCFYINKTKANITISNIQIEVNNTATDYEDCDCQKVTLANADVNSLHTYYPSTTVICDSDFQLTYIADTKNYIDSKFNELATALIAHESEVN